jgi:hypothetical protein
VAPQSPHPAPLHVDTKAVSVAVALANGPSAPVSAYAHTIQQLQQQVAWDGVRYEKVP